MTRIHQTQNIKPSFADVNGAPRSGSFDEAMILLEASGADVDPSLVALWLRTGLLAEQGASPQECDALAADGIEDMLEADRQDLMAQAELAKIKRDAAYRLAVTNNGSLPFSERKF